MPLSQGLIDNHSCVIMPINLLINLAHACVGLWDDVEAERPRPAAVRKCEQLQSKSSASGRAFKKGIQFCIRLLRIIYLPSI